MARKKTWAEKFAGTREPHFVVLDRAYAGVPAGARLLISSPKDVAAEIRSVHRGRTLAVTELRQRLAKRHGADATCPTSTGIFLRVVAEAALEEVAAGTPLSKTIPFWRVVDPASALAKKLSCGPDLIRRQREAEGV
jgi:hypothetical protein